MYSEPNSNKFESVDGGAMNIGVAPGGQPWVVNKNGGIFYRGRNNRWTEIHGSASDISVGTDGVVWITGTDKIEGGHSIFRY
jgi:hypothetical protein